MLREVSLEVAPTTDDTKVFNQPDGAQATPLEPITYDAVEMTQAALLTEKLLARGKSLKRIDNFHTAMRGWRRELGLAEDDPVGKEFGMGFASSLDQHLKTLEREGKTKQTIDDRRSLIKMARETWVGLLQSLRHAQLSEGFVDSLRKLMAASGHSIRGLASEVGISNGNLHSWLHEKTQPSKRCLPVIARIEQVYGLPHGALAAKLPRLLLGAKGTPRRGTTAYRRHVQKVMKIRYLLNDFPPELQRDWENLYRFYTDSVWVRLHRMQRVSKWRVREHDGRCPTANIVRSQLRRCFGYAVQPKDGPLQGGGYQLEELSLAMLSDSDFVLEFLRWDKERNHLKQYNNFTKSFLHFCCALLRAKTGFLWQMPKLGERLPAQVPADEWHSWCEGNREVLRETVKEWIKDKIFKMTRDPFEPIRAYIVNNQHPIDVLFDLADNFERERPPRNSSPVRKAAHYQSLLLIKFATHNPMRVFNFSVMTYRADNTGNLYQRQDGSWWTRFDPSYFKNHYGEAGDNPFDVPLNESLWPYIEEYLRVHRKHLVGADQCDYVFRPVSVRAHKDQKVSAPVSTKFLSRTVFKITQRCLPGCAGFGLHAFRHLVATEYIKNNPGGYAVAAAILHDREITVRESYDWVTPSDKIVFWNAYLTAQHDRRRREEKLYREAA